MKPAPFDYHRAVDVDDAIAALGSSEEAKAIAGGQSLIALMNLRLARPDLLVDIKPLRELDYIEPTADGGLKIGALTSQRSIERSKLVEARCPLMFEAMPSIAHAVIRNHGTIGGSLAHADSGSELCTVSLAIGARMRVRGPSGDRDVPSTEFFLGPLTTALDSDELLTEIIIPPSPARSGFAYTEVSRRKGDFALAGVGGVVGLADDGTVDQIRVAYTSLGPTALRSPTVEEFLRGSRPDPATIDRAVDLVAQDVSPGDSIHGSAEYRLRLARVLTRRVLTTAVDRAAAALS
jgi:aerobic carbon-monoxide dehydrogenase medium subunit